MSYTDVFLKDFTKDNAIKWIEEALGFFKAPKLFVAKTSAKTKEDLIPQFLFYFILYTLSFFLLLIGNDPLAALRPAILNLVNAILMISIFSFLSYILERRNYLKEITIFILSVILFSNPLILLLQSQFLNTENFGYKLGAGIISAASQILCFILFPFFLSMSRRAAWKTCLFIFIIINIGWVILTNFSFDKYENKSNMYSIDPIISEYNETYEELFFKEEIPTFRVFYWNEKGRQSGFWVQDVSNGKNELRQETDGNAVYIKSIQNNISLLDKRILSAKYQRNKDILLSWKDYFQKVQPLTDVNNFSGSAVSALLKDDQIGMDSVNGHPRTFMRIDYKSVVANQVNLKRMHNEIVNAFNSSELPIIIANRIRYMLGFILDGVFTDYLQNQKFKPYRDRFNPIDSGL